MSEARAGVAGVAAKSKARAGEAGRHKDDAEGGITNARAKEGKRTAASCTKEFRDQTE
jgi:hypothetical protein